MYHCASCRTTDPESHWSFCDPKDREIADLRRQLAERESECAGLREQNERLGGPGAAMYLSLAHGVIERILSDAALLRVRTLEEGLDILTRACEAGAYVGRTSPAVTQARALLAPTTDGKADGR